MLLHVGTEPQKSYWPPTGIHKDLMAILMMFTLCSQVACVEMCSKQGNYIENSLQEGVTKTRKENGTENRMNRKICDAIYTYTCVKQLIYTIFV